ncbi:hypothetical protein pEaSNUABM40_00341 [Erwinia phage pEa_SNUABM_40]|uniref:Uncharacterized protein n=1 Tax=Erwinia phage pEa_SNUABM_3 TaxID=2869552 RepID=A0AAE7XJF0_9CAUD|nr:hypothetical protein MPK68_gp339 [Erwinia phage pEa_SNUABM_3]QZE56873.1 hypothetical protein pEaSNUABM20_00337 [Erwinia phage pEa_SNUABM_20]QZE58557.1 hypothetical protein pEaSNUABM40_00341 [Erwinia phage pEa_SNUABM_40]UAW53118.1 hypothetical protein pEaSNUABM23_00336 [Erwinia phage pEa_SNUABM_23]UIW11013.1 hypothetical protein pEaSNUABM23_00336 [Erwinia phage pEa_SNUABM_31]QZE56536.1 hypothetical protein pEaSNUABM3_00339 [Erwinia phage pEa_SNUABM_3]
MRGHRINMQAILNTDVERSALALFSRPQLEEDYKRTVMYLVYKTVNRNGMMQVKRLMFELSQTYGLNKEDVMSAISALKAPATFNALSVFVPRADMKANRVCRVNSNTAIESWIAEVEATRPHITRLLQ